MTDLSGITVCLGDFSPNDPFTAEDIEETLVKIGAKHPAQHQVKVDTTHFLCTRENKQNPEYTKANDMNIPIIRPEWIKACERERRIVGVRDFYIKDCVLPDLFAKNYWGDGHKSRSSGGETATPVGATDGATTASAVPEVTLNDTTEPIESSKSDLPPLPAKEEKGRLWRMRKPLSLRSHQTKMTNLLRSKIPTQQSLKLMTQKFPPPSPTQHKQ